MTPAESDRFRRRNVHETWRGQHMAKLGALPAAVRAEVEALALDRHRADKAAAITRADVLTCESRVVSRLRLRAYGSMPDSPDEFERQRNEIRAQIGLTPVYRAPAQQAAE